MMDRCKKTATARVRTSCEIHILDLCLDMNTRRKKVFEIKFMIDYSKKVHSQQCKHENSNCKKCNCINNKGVNFNQNTILLKYKYLQIERT